MNNHAELIAALRIPMNVTLPGAPELDVYDEQRKAAADALEAVWAEVYRRGQEDMRERAALLCNERGAREQEAYGLKRAAQNYFRALDCIRALPIKEKADE